MRVVNQKKMMNVCVGLDSCVVRSTWVRWTFQSLTIQLLSNVSTSIHCLSFIYMNNLRQMNGDFYLFIS